MATRKSSEKEAWKVLNRLKFQIIDILWNDNSQQYNNDHLLIPWLQEEAEYQIKKLGLPEERRDYFIRKIYQIVGEYTEQI